MNTNDKKAIKAALIWLLIYGGLFIASTCQAQTKIPFLKPLCPEAIEWKARYERTRQILDSTRAVGDRLLIAKAERIKAVVSTGNQQLKDGAKREEALNTLNGQYRIGLRLLAKELREEAERPRLFGIGRRQAVRRFEAFVVQLLDY